MYLTGGGVAAGVTGMASNLPPSLGAPEPFWEAPEDREKQ